ncbi:hypothetical protein FBZ99_107229 [Rhizobium sp. ERR 1071]|uniref:hypothetical protein n=1 Tax=Rhizobium sp. ERR 1071 TaxID=2572677 RepID=UPI00119B8183|nr:hypothetical protein [Rhizobium sp. ERR1071]TWB12179.1 hypothetical protein FBZ99_107229 [Rhizobium sp. ERR1071]
MNDPKAQNDFKRAIQLLLAEMKRSVGPGSPVAYAGELDGEVLEHTTRKFFIDRLLQALGWELGPAGDMSEEARIKAETTIFMDYVGVSDHSRLPLFVIEAKGWDKPFISPSDSIRTREQPGDLIIRAIEHVKNGGEKESSPVIGAWHDYLSQVLKYVKSLKDQHGHDLARVLLTSGQWMVIFEHPSRTFLGTNNADPSDIILLREADYVAHSTDILDLLGRHKIAATIPSTLRPAQLGTFVKADDVARLFHGLHVRYEASGSSRFEPRPRILVYPAIIIERSDGILLQVLREGDGIPLPTSDDGIVPHLSDIERHADELLLLCRRQLDMTLSVSALEQFPGFPPKGRRARLAPTVPLLLDDQAETPNEWMLLTGQFKHYLRPIPVKSPCAYHSFAGCLSVGQQSSYGAISIRRVSNPRVFFVDTQDHHCAHLAMRDRKDERCRIMAIDEMTCCQACIYMDSCWTPGELATLPCGL